MLPIASIAIIGPMELLRPDVAASKKLKPRSIALDESISWGCSARGWNCCVDKTIAVEPYSLIRLRHATGKSSQALINEQLVTLHWQHGLLTGALAHVAYESKQRACVFYEELTNHDIRRIRDDEPDRYSSLPLAVQQAADRDQASSYRVAGLCGVHTGRPEACRGFPFQRKPDWETRPDESPAVQLNRCGTCALSGPTTPREVMLDNDLEEYWRADDAWRRVKLYLLSHGLADTSDPGYAALPITPETRAELWVSCFVPDGLPAVAERFPEQWQRPLDLEGDREILRIVLTNALDRVDALVAEVGADPNALGGDETTEPRPQVDRLLDPARVMLPLLAAA